MSAQLQMLVSVLLGMHLASVCLATYRGEGRANISLVSLSLAGDPSIRAGWLRVRLSA